MRCCCVAHLASVLAALWAVALLVHQLFGFAQCFGFGFSQPLLAEQGFRLAMVFILFNISRSASARPLLLVGAGVVALGVSLGSGSD
eukprot:UN14802